MESTLFNTFVLVFCGAAALASVALYTRQPILVAYILLGALLGPFGLKMVPHIEDLSEMAHIGIVFLLFLLGLDMQPSALLSVLRSATSVGMVSSAAFAVIGFAIGSAFGYSLSESMVIGMASMFSSTIIGIKLLPTTVLHHKHTGELMVGLLLLQDFLAILCLLVLLSGGGSGEFAMTPLLAALVALPTMVLFAFFFVKWILIKLITRFDRFSEYIFLLAIGWCLGLSVLAEHVYLSAEIGAFIAGISLATSPIAQYLALNLKPLRDFFLVLFFFAVGAQLNLPLLNTVIFAAAVYAAAMLIAKPVIFYLLLRQQSETPTLAWDIGFRLGQISEFSLLITFVAVGNTTIGSEASMVIQTAAIITFIISSYIVIFNFPNPVAASEKLRRD